MSSKTSLIEVLKKIGLNEKEAKVYLACIETGSAPVSEVAKAAGINRVTTYDILDKLKKKALVSHFTKNKVKYFTGTDPDIVLEEFEKRTKDLREAIPQFKRLTGKTNHPRIRYFEGLEGIKAIYTDTLNSTTEILNYSNSEEIRKIWTNYDEEYVEKRAKKKIFLRGICPDDKYGETVHQQDKKYHREMRLISADQFDFTNEINIYDDKVAIISFKDELIGMIIESSEIANSQRAIFNMCWQWSEIMNADENGIIKKKLLQPLYGKDLKDSLEREQKAQKKEVKKKVKKIEETQEEKDSNLSLF